MSTQETASFLQCCVKYNPALQAKLEALPFYLIHYANTLVGNKLIAALITESVMAAPDEKSCRALTPAERLISLHIHTHALCRQWLDAKTVIFNLRKPKNPT